MAVLEINYMSQVLKLSSDMIVILPENRDEGKKVPVLYLLHGLSDNHHAWMQKTSLLRYVNDIYPNLCVVMPAGDRSFYTDMVYGKDYYKHIAEELPEILQNMFHITADRDKTYVAGLSMGGYGALKIGFSKKDRFSKIASFSPVAYVQEIFNRVEDGDSSIKKVGIPIYGENLKVKDVDDTKKLAKDALNSNNTPELMLCCGTDDGLYDNYCEYAKYLDNIGFEYIRYDDDGFEHTWDYWDICIQRALKFFAQ